MQLGVVGGSEGVEEGLIGRKACHSISSPHLPCSSVPYFSVTALLEHK